MYIKNCKLFFIIIFFLNISSVLITAQSRYKKCDFRAPMSIPLQLSGNFGELRPGHFHAGLDFRTQGVEGKKIYAIAEGYVSRVVVSPYGYGKAVYIRHPNGYESVYAHLKSFNQKIIAYIRNIQYKTKNFRVTVYPAPEKLPVRKGEIIGLSGNTGSSGGPHLHFEIRDAFTEHPLNPLLFKFDIKDEIQPRIFNLYIYPIDNNTVINETNKKLKVKVYGSNGKYYIRNKLTIGGNTGFGITAFDYLNGSHYRCAIYSVELFVNNKRVYFQQFDEISFNESRYINSYKDYEEYYKHRTKIHKSFVEPNNQLNFYKELINNGIINFKPDETYHIEYKIKDVYGNLSTLDYTISGAEISDTKKPDIDKTTICMPYQKANYFNKSDIRIAFPEGAFYDTLFFTYKKKDNTFPTIYSDIHSVHNCFVPVHRSYIMEIKPINLPEYLRQKAIIVYTRENGSMYSVGGRWNNGFVRTDVRGFGRFAVSVDNTPPTIKPLNIFPNANLKSASAISFLISDDLSGIKSYSGFIDRKWVLFEYDAKKNRIWYIFDKKVNAGKHTLELEVSDNKDNITTYCADFYR